MTPWHHGQSARRPLRPACRRFSPLQRPAHVLHDGPRSTQHVVRIGELRLSACGGVVDDDNSQDRGEGCDPLRSWCADEDVFRAPSTAHGIDQPPTSAHVTRLGIENDRFAIRTRLPRRKPAIDEGTCDSAAGGTDRYRRPAQVPARLRSRGAAPGAAALRRSACRADRLIRPRWRDRFAKNQQFLILAAT